MRRRGFLATLSVVAMAGCTGSTPSGDPTEAESPTNRPTSSPAATRTPTGTTARPSTDQPTTADQATETATETETPHPAAKYVERARADLQATVDVYVSQRASSNVAFLDVTASTTGFSPGEVHAAANEAREEIARAEEHDDGTYSETLDALTTIRVFLDRAADLQARLVGLYETVEAVIEEFESGDYERARGTADELAGAPDEAGDGLDDLKDETGAGAMDASDGLSADDYEEKLAQFEAEIDAFGVLEETLPDFVDALEGFHSSAAAYVDPDETPTGFPGTFDDVAAMVSDTPHPRSLSTILEEIEDVSSCLEAVSDHMGDAVAALRDGNTSTAEQRECDAVEAIEDCAELEEYPAVDPLDDLPSC